MVGYTEVMHLHTYQKVRYYSLSPSEFLYEFSKVSTISRYKEGPKGNMTKIIYMDSQSNYFYQTFNPLFELGSYDAISYF